jgi:hypothetical protein
MVEYDTPMKGQKYIQECKEQTQEDILCYIDVKETEGWFHPEKTELIADDLCQIVVDNFKKLEK